MATSPHATRIDFVDHLKALGIVLVVIGHAAATPPSWASVIYAFHMPLFFWISGYLLGLDHRPPGAACSIRRRVRSLWWPYLAFFTLSWLYWLATAPLAGRASEAAGTPWHAPLLGLLRGRSEDLPVNVALWFFPCLIAVHVGYGLLRRGVSARGAALLCLTLAIVVSAWAWRPATRWPWELDTAAVAIGVFALGAVSPAPVAWLATRGRGALQALALGAGGLGLLAMLHNGRVDLQMMNFGRAPPLYLPIALLGIALSLAVTLRLPALRASRWLSDRALVIFPSHLLVFNALGGGATLLGLPHEVTLEPWFGVLSVLLGLAAGGPLGAGWARLQRR
ncbi:MAG TPA: acyltransferase family protein [Methylibium sp.]|nr:acyltransferase family protein [Methylibium sp.]